MSWGSPFAAAWNAATDTAKAVAYSAAQTSKSAYDYVADRTVAGLSFAGKEIGAGLQIAGSAIGKAYDVVKRPIVDDAALVGRSAKNAYNKTSG